MKIIPVIDIQNGVTVRGVAGERESYQPLKSLLTESVDPSVVLKVLQDSFGLSDFYVADLDAIQHQQPNRCTLAELQQYDGMMYCDAGVRSLDDAEILDELHVSHIVLGLESLTTVDLAKSLMAQYGPERLVFSLDMKQGTPLAVAEEWRHSTVLEVFRHAADIGYRRFIVLDLAAVGMGSGISSLDVCRTIRKELSEAEIICGGGVRHVADLTSAEQAGANGVLIASALHDRSLTPDDVRWWRG